ncbi:hypothetical protein E8E12_005809 [Didymella heteroderae]|uniref:F-box domain-containing protein n=1 Tax=Didymella heteroderae TaxID=1769908 RepID=A0A9P4WWQ1_9PLEO|nr:hypothetical protein E8E12_005809 [Didymella heteroderae]
MTTRDGLLGGLSPATPSSAFDDFPEEIIERIISLFTVQWSLAAAALVSRRLNRIGTPHIYTAVTLVLAKSAKSIPLVVKPLETRTGPQMDIFHFTFDLPSAESCNALAFVMTVMRRPELAQHVKLLELIRNDEGYDIRRAIGFSDLQGQKVTKLAAAAPTQLSWRSFTDAMDERPARVVDQPYELVCSVLRTLPQVNFIDAYEHTTDVPGDPFMNTIQSLATLTAVQHDFIFTIPHLSELMLRDIMLVSVTSVDLDDWKLTVPRNSIMRLALYNVDTPRVQLPVQDTAPILLMLGACRRLKHLAIATSAAGLWQVMLGCCSQRFTALETLGVLEVGPSTSVMVGLALAERQVLYAPMPVCRLRESEGIWCLNAEVGMLLALTPVSENNEHAGRVERYHSMAQLPGQLFDAHINITLPRSLETLNLMANKEKRLQIILLTTLESMHKDVRDRFPSLRKLEVAWELGGIVTEERGADNLSPELVEAFRRKGLEVVQSLG